MLQTQAIKTFLEAKTHSDLAALYTEEMEVQVNVAQDGGTRITKEYKGRKWHGWADPQDPTLIWKPLRIPYKAKTNPEYTPRKMTWPLGAHAEGIGMTGWNWVQRKSLWVAFDFDSIANHKQGLTAEELDELRTAAMTVPWVTVRKSTSGRGFHIYVFLPSVPTKNHTEHAALARAILGLLCAKTGFDFRGKVDAMGGNMWVWHRKMAGTDGLRVVKKGEILTDIPSNWEDHLEVVKGNRRKNLPRYVEVDAVDEFEELCGTRPRIKLDRMHLRLQEYLDEISAQWWWDSDHWMMVCHTADLKRAHESLGLKGIFDTIATGKMRGADHNCFCYALRKGAWSIRRYTPGVKEHASWSQDGQGWTCCYFNQEPDLGIAARSHDGVETEQGGYVFTEAEIARTVASTLGAEIELPPWAVARETILKHHKKDGRLIVEIKREPNDNGNDMRGWRAEKVWWKRIYNVKAAQSAEPEVGNYDELVRHLITQQGDDYGWVVNSGNSWQTEPITHIRLSLKSLNFTDREINVILGNSVLRGWTIVNIPFEAEFPGDRQWNRNAAQLRFKPKLEEPFEYPTWQNILDHCGVGLDEAVQKHPWCQQFGVLTGGEYLKLWVASLFQRPTAPLPYLFFFSEQENTGKTTFHEALSLLMTKGYVRADVALNSSSAFNGELENAVLCVVEEINLSERKDARNRMKDWVLTTWLPIHRKNHTPYNIPNTTHWIQTANDPTFCPVFPGDTRIVMCYVPPIEDGKMIGKGRLHQLLEKEASDFLGAIMAMDLPITDERTTIPIVETQEKKHTARGNMSPLELFIDERCHKIAGASIKFSDFYTQFQAWLDPEEAGNWSKIRVGRELPRKYPKGRNMQENAQFFVGNLSLDAAVKPCSPWALRDNKLIR